MAVLRVRRFQFFGLCDGSDGARKVSVSLARPAENTVVRRGRPALNGGPGERQRFGQVSICVQQQSGKGRRAVGVLRRHGGGFAKGLLGR